MINRQAKNLVRDLILGFSNAGDVILDCFMGSGTSGVASKITGRSFIGYEINTEFFSIAEGRVQSAVLEQKYLTPSNKACTRQGQVAPQFDNFE